jgi:hypothetical protein
MHPGRITEILDLAKQARQLGHIFNPLFVGDAGLGKSEIIKQWVKKEQKANPEFGFVDLRLAYYEGPDFIGYPYEYEKDGETRMGHALPHFWPTKGSGVILLEEPNRGNTMVMNCLMQLCDANRSVGPNYTLPEGWIIVAAMNQEGAKYDVNNMDEALKDRFEIFPVDYDYKEFMKYVHSANWHPQVVQYLNSKAWLYKTPEAIGSDGKYVSPRTWSKINSAELSGASDHKSKRQIHRIVCQGILGKHIGNEYWKTCWDDAPVTANDILQDKKKALKKLKTQSGAGTDYAGDKIAVTVESVIENFGGWYEGMTSGGKPVANNPDLIDEATMAEIVAIIPSDQALNMIKECGQKLNKEGKIGRVQSYLKDFTARHPKAVAIMKDHIKIDKAIKSKDK